MPHNVFAIPLKSRVGEEGVLKGKEDGGEGVEMGRG